MSENTFKGLISMLHAVRQEKFNIIDMDFSTAHKTIIEIIDQNMDLTHGQQLSLSMAMMRLLDNNTYEYDYED